MSGNLDQATHSRSIAFYPTHSIDIPDTPDTRWGNLYIHPITKKELCDVTGATSPAQQSRNGENIVTHTHHEQRYVPTEADIDIRPVIFHQTVVYTGDSGSRDMMTYPISVDYHSRRSSGYTDLDIDNGETVIASVPATPGTYSVYMWEKFDDGHWNDHWICTIIGGSPNEPDQKVAGDPGYWLGIALDKMGYNDD